MINFSWLKKYSCIDDDFANNMQKYKHKFTPLNYEEIVAQEERMGRRFPEELRELYIHSYNLRCSHIKGLGSCPSSLFF